MATAAQVRANRENAKRSSGPLRTDPTRFNGLKHGLRAEQVVLPGESQDEFDAERKAWFDDWRPMTHTRAVLVERAAVASWRLRRAVRAEASRLYEAGADVAHEFDMRRRELVDCALHLLPRDPGAAVARLRSDAAGIDCLIGLWEGLARAAADPAGWTSRQDHHDRLLGLLGHPAGSDPQGLEAARASLTLLRANGAGAGAPVPSEVAGAAAAVRAVCAERSAELRRERSGFWDPPVLHLRMVDAACAPTSKEAQLMHRYEMAHEKSLRSALRQLLTLERSGADLPDEPEPEPEPEPPAVPEATAAGPTGPEESASNNDEKISCAKLASVGAVAPAGGRPGTPAGPRGRCRGPVGADPGPEMAAIRR